jgi:hypothetical protein
VAQFSATPAHGFLRHTVMPCAPHLHRGDWYAL